MDDEVVLRAPMFAAIDAAAAHALFESMTRFELARGRSVFAEGDPGDRLYVIGSGAVKLGRRSPDGRENLLSVLGPGEMFGELSLFDPGPRTATATAVNDAVLYELGHGELIAWLELHPAVAKHLLQALARRLRRTNEALGDLVFADVPGRVAKALLDLSTRRRAPRAPPASARRPPPPCRSPAGRRRRTAAGRRSRRTSPCGPRGRTRRREPAPEGA